MTKVPANRMQIAQTDDDKHCLVFFRTLNEGMIQLITPARNPVEGTNLELLEYMLAELQEFGYLDMTDEGVLNIDSMCFYTLWSTQRDLVDGTDWHIDPSKITSLAKEPIFNPQPGPEKADQFIAWQTLRDYFDAHGLSFHGNDNSELNIHLADLHNSFTAPQVAAYRCLAAASEQVIPSLLLIAGELTPNQFSNATTAGTPFDVTFGFPVKDKSPEENHGEYIRLMRDLATRCENFIRLSEDPVFELIKAGESEKVEFKSTLRYDLRGKKNNPEIEHAVLKELCAFMNTKGGTILVGVGDDGDILGIECDGFQNSDKWQLHLRNLIRDKLGSIKSTLVNTRPIQIGDKTIMEIKCLPSSDPAYLKMKGKDSPEEFYIRTGPAAQILRPSEIVEYLDGRRKKS